MAQQARVSSSHRSIRVRGSRRVVGAVVLLAASLAGSACSVIDIPRGPGAPSSMDARAAGYKVDPEQYAKVGYRLDWRGFPTVVPGERITSAVAFGDILAVQESGSTVSELEAANGSVRWSNALAGRLTRFVGINRLVHPKYGDTLAVSSQSEVFLLSTQTGNLVGRQSFGQVVNTEPVIAGSLAIYGTATGEVLAHVLTAGVKAWGFATSGAIDFKLVQIGGVVAAVSQSGAVNFVDISTGQLVGHAQMFAGLATDIATDGTNLYVASLDQSVYGFSTSGRELWRYRTSQPLRMKPTVSDGVLYCTTDIGLTAFDAATGKVIWSKKDVAGVVVAKRRGNLLVWNNPKMQVVEPKRGDVIDSAELPGMNLLTFDKFEDGAMYAASQSGLIAKFLPR